MPFELDDEGDLLEVTDLRKTFGGLVAVDDVSVSVEAGSITGLIGPNGAGKSTLFDLISGFLSPDQGTITFDGEQIDGSPPEIRASNGIVKTFQIPHTLSGMRVEENLRLAAQNHPGERVLPSIAGTGAVRDAERTATETTEHWLGELDLWDLRTEYGGNLSGGQKKLLELGRALVADPDLLLLDEPTAGVNPSLTEELLPTIEEIRTSQDLTVLLIEHDMDVIREVCDTVIGMNNGQIVTVASPEEITHDERMREAYFGGS